MGVEGMTFIKKWNTQIRLYTEQLTVWYPQGTKYKLFGSTIQLIYVPNPESLETGFLGMFCL